MGRIGAGELFFILLIVVVLFGSSKIPQLGRGLGEGIRNFKRGLRGDDEEPDASPRSDSTQNPR
jgi:sec-independent protein translocase protein TatA